MAKRKNKGPNIAHGMGGVRPAPAGPAGDNLRYKTQQAGGFNPMDTDPGLGDYNATFLQLDMATDTVGPILEKVTNGYFTGDVGQLNAASMYTASLTAGNEAYYVDVTNNGPNSGSVATQFSVTYGHYAGSGSNNGVSNQEYGATQAIYGQLANLLLPINHQTGGFMIEASDTRDDGIYALVTERTLMKDKLNKKQWTLALNMNTASLTEGGLPAVTNRATGSHKTFYFTDDSNTTPGVATPGGMRYNIVSGSDGVPSSSAKTYGWFYPELGMMVFSENALSGSMPGIHASGSGAVAKFNNPVEKAVAGSVEKHEGSAFGFASGTSSTANSYNPLRFVNALTNDGGYLKLRNEEDQYSRHYFVRATANNFNFSNNPTFTSGSSNRLKYDYMLQNPQVLGY